MSYYLMSAAGLSLSALFFWDSGRTERRLLFYLFWTAGNLSLIIGLILFNYVTLFDQDLQALPYFHIALLAGFALLIIARIAAIFYDKSSYDSIIAEERQQRAISEITQLAASSGSLIELLNFSLDKMVNMLGMSAGAIHIFHTARQNMVLGSYNGLSARLARRMETLELDQTAIGRTAKNKRLLIIRNLRFSPDYEFFGGRIDKFTHAALIPVISEGEHWGVASLFGKGAYRPGKLKVDLLEQFGEQLGAALVLGRRMRTTLTSADNMKALLNSLGDELYIKSKIARSGEGVARGVAWSLTRILGGDRFDIAVKNEDSWRISLSSEPETIGQALTRNSDLKYEFETVPSGILAWDQPPPFREFVERRPYLFCCLPDKNYRMFIRLESRRRSTVDFEFFYNAGRIVHGLSKLMKADLPSSLLESPAIKPAESRASNGISPKEAAKLAGKVSGTLERIAGDLEKLIGDYSSSDSGSDLKSLVGWLEVIRKSASDGAGLAHSIIYKKEHGRKKADGFRGLVDEAIDRVSNSKKQIPEIEFQSDDNLPSTTHNDETISKAIRRFLTLALGKADKSGKIILTAKKADRAINLEITGDKLSPAPDEKEMPHWLKAIGGRLEFGNGHNGQNRIVNRWKLVIPPDINDVKIDRPGRERPKVLAVDSQDIIRELLTGMLSGIGCDSEAAESSDMAIGLFKQAANNKDPFEIVIADYALDNLSGAQLSARLKSIDPNVSFVLISGWGLEPDPDEVEKSGIDRVLKKPFRIEQLADTVAGLKRKAVGQ